MYMFILIPAWLYQDILFHVFLIGKIQVEISRYWRFYVPTGDLALVVAISKHVYHCLISKINGCYFNKAMPTLFQCKVKSLQILMKKEIKTLGYIFRIHIIIIIIIIITTTTTFRL